MFRRARKTALLLYGPLLFTSTQARSSDSSKKIDASDPTRIVTFLGAGPRYNNYVDDTTVSEAHLSLTMGLGAKDMFTVETGYGHYNRKNVDQPSKSGMVMTQIRHFHLHKMDDKVEKGYRGWGSSLRINIAGGLPGTDGQNNAAGSLLVIS